MKLSKNYELKKSKSDEIISFTFPIINNRNRKNDSPTRRLPDSVSQRLPDCASQRLPALYKKHPFTFKALIFCPKTSVELIESLSIKAIKVAKILT
jgi:hypothetical protein